MEQNTSKIIKMPDHSDSTGNKYAVNETMQLLGQQTIYHYVCMDGIAHNDFMNVLHAEISTRSGFFDAAIDFFSLGFIYGKRTERARKGGHNMTPAEKAKETRKKNKAARETAMNQGKETREKVRAYCEGILDSPSSSTEEKLKACDLLLRIAR